MTPRTRRILEFVLDNLVWFMLLFVLVIFSAFLLAYPSTWVHRLAGIAIGIVMFAAMVGLVVLGRGVTARHPDAPAMAAATTVEEATAERARQQHSSNDQSPRAVTA